MRPRLRIFTGDDDCRPAAEPQVNIRLGDVTRALAEAVLSDRAWLSDFEDDEIRVSADLYEVISAYTHLRPSA